MAKGSLSPPCRACRPRASTIQRAENTRPSDSVTRPGAGLPALAQSGAEVLPDVCAACHATAEDGTLERIDAVRKTPEAWDMTVVRMMRNHGVSLTPDERRTIVAHLADTRGLTIAETEGWRYILEKEPVATDSCPDELMAQTCGRCHSYARVALQRRTPEDWEHLIHFHLGQFPSLEYQALARDRDWWGIANAEIIPFLAETYPLGDSAEAFGGDLSGAYVVTGHEPGRGAYSGTLELTCADGGYDASMTLDYGDGSETYTGSGVIYGAGEWRATLSSGETTIRQVMALQDGMLSGRWFVADRDPVGGRLTALPVGAAPQILSMIPAPVPVGEPTEVTLIGSGLDGAPMLPEGTTAEVVEAGPNRVVLPLTAQAEGALSVGLGDLGAPADLVAYDGIDRISIGPDVSIARIGGNGGPIPKVPAQFEAMGWADDPDGEAGTDDDLPLGVVVVSWSVDNWDEAAAAIEDAKYAGSIDETGLFTPGGAGPNPERFMGTNNTGNLKVIATYEGAAEPLTAEAHLYATVQRFVDTPIR
ncbi:quinohemoprotein amine dehydrogenase subunit alpha [Ponticoccus alexandrii]|uniref:quinohemoprotein amine dehydrogenase subunit alpha n=1 Tax=Ponticoccus alexandrii TaxID=1943633 RepID=UPI00203B4D4B|nr:quinohemoprotein amine dehydrogenase subunit alpha [Ponticoccus alexandrii]